MRFALSRATGLACPIRLQSVRSVIFTVALIGLAMACGGSDQPTAPSSLLPVLPPPTAPAPPIAPDTAVSNNEIYLGEQTLYPRNDLFLTRYVLAKVNSSFRFEFYDYYGQVSRYPGHYSRTNSLITFTFNTCFLTCFPGVWGATATIHGDSLSVSYNEAMHESNFVDGVYVLAR